MSVPQILFRLDAGPDQGLGHLRRCLALASAFRKGHADVVFVARDPHYVRSWTKGYAVETVEFGTARCELEDFKRLLSRKAPDLLIIDHYDYGAEHLKFIRRSWPGPVLCFDDMGSHRQWAVDGIINHNVYAPDLAYPRNRKLFLGCHYTLISPDIMRFKKRKPSETLPVLFLSLGGAADASSLKIFVNAFMAAKRRMKALKGLMPVGISSGRRPKVDGLKWVPARHAARAMASCNFALSAAGVTSYELAFLGVPSLLTVFADNQAKLARGLDREGCAAYIGDFRRLTADRIAGQIISFWQHQALRRKMSDRGQALVDGKGADRLAAAISRAFL